jgi:MOSC domain-containing protein YiiM
MHEVPAASITVERGVEGDGRGKAGRRQVTILTRQGWDAACSDLNDKSLCWTSRRANLLIDGVEFRGTIGYDLRVGDAVLSITGETSPCGRMDEIRSGLRAALKPDWRGGVTGRVTQSGEVTVGCEVVLTRNVLRQYSLVLYDRARRFYKWGRRKAGNVARRLGWKRGRERVIEHD